MAFINERKEDGEWQTIDRERDIVLLYLGGGRPQESVRFELKIKSIKIRFDALRTTQNLPIKKMEVTWDVTNIYAPNDQNKQNMKAYIEEALRGYGFAASTDLVETLHVNFIHEAT